MPTLWDFEIMSVEENKNWETLHSSLIRYRDATYEQCRAYACQNITDGLTKMAVKKGEIVEIPQGVPFHFIGRVDTSNGNNSLQSYYQSYMDREFVSYTTICKKNVSHYKGDIFFIYNICPEDIVHIFPIDSDAVDYRGDILYDWFKLKSISEVIEKRYGFSVESMYYTD